MLEAADKVEIRILVDNATDMLSSNPSFQRALNADIIPENLREALMHRFLAAALVTCALTLPALAQQLPAMTTQTANIKRTPLQKFDVPGAGYETVIGLAEIAPNANIGRHTHPGVEGGYLIDGGMTLMVEGQPPKEIKPGDSWQIPPGTIHDAKAGVGGAKVIASYVVEKGKPLATPAP